MCLAIAKFKHYKLDVFLSRPKQWWMYLHSKPELDLFEEACAEIRALLAMDLTDPRENFYWEGERMKLQHKAAQWLAHYLEKIGEDQERDAVLAAWNGEYEDVLPDVTGVTFDYAFPSEVYGLTVAEEAAEGSPGAIQRVALSN